METAYGGKEGLEPKLFRLQLLILIHWVWGLKFNPTNLLKIRDLDNALDLFRSSKICAFLPSLNLSQWERLLPHLAQVGLSLREWIDSALKNDSGKTDST